MYAVKDIFYTIQGEGANAGRAAVFVRFAGCNGWSGLERDREKGPLRCSRWCDTDFVGGRKYHEDALVAAILSQFPQDQGYRFIVFTGGEPALQLTDTLIRKLLKTVPSIAIETNGSLLLPSAAFEHCWITVSPKTDKVVQDKASELKLVYPTIYPEKFDYIKAPWRFLQPLWTASFTEREANVLGAIDYIKAHPQWRLSLQTHKYAGIP
jgi:7-carboxy-7-deazaguanine synthase